MVSLSDAVRSQKMMPPQAHHAGGHGENGNGDAAIVLQRRLAAHAVRVRPQDHDNHQQEIERHAGVEADQEPRRELIVVRQEHQGRDAHQCREDKPPARLKEAGDPRIPEAMQWLPRRGHERHSIRIRGFPQARGL